MLGDFVPVDDLPEGSEIIGAFVLVFQVVGMFPNVHAKNGRALYFGYIHQWVVLVGGGADLQLPILYNQPCPSAAKTAQPGSIEFFLEGIEAAEGGVDLIGQLS